MSILEMGSGQKVTIGDALKYIGLDIMIPSIEQCGEEKLDDEAEEEKKPKLEEDDHPDLPKTLCQECLDKLQSVYEFKFRCEENREYLRTYLKEMAEAKEIETEAARQVAMAELDIDLNNLDSLPDKLVLKPQVKKQRKPRKARDPTNPPKKRRVPDKSIIIAEDSQVESAIYVRKVVITPEKSPEQKHSNKRKSKHVVIEDIPVAEKPKQTRYDRNVRKKEPLFDENNKNESNSEVEKAEEEPSTSLLTEMRDEEPIFEDEVEQTNKRPKRSKK
jgi:Zinc-finger associated domain (zf-AD)